MVLPKIQWLGSGFGQKGSTWNEGASLPSLSAATAYWSSMTSHAPRISSVETKEMPRIDLSLVVIIFPFKQGFLLAIILITIALIATALIMIELDAVYSLHIPQYTDPPCQ